MRLITFDAGNGPRAGVELDSSIADAWDLLGENDEGGVRGLIAGERLADLAAAIEGGGFETIEAAGARLLPPVPDPEKIICIGLNYVKHAEETGQELPKAPIIFGKYNNALVGPDSTVTLPAASTKADYEAEVAVVIGRRAGDVPVEDAIDHVAGYTLLNDLSARDLQGLSSQWMAGKVFDGSAPCGPALVTTDEAGSHDAIGISLTLNGKEMQNSSTADMIFPVPELISRISEWMTLQPGDIIATGTPPGVGMGQKPRVWLEHGDEITVSSPRIGELTTTIRR